jgi:hypothetical protein
MKPQRLVFASFLTTVLFAFLQITSFAQTTMPNSGFEQWTGNKPTSWDAPNMQYSIFIIQTVFKDSLTPYAGNNCALIQTKVFNLLVATPTIPGILTLGKVVINTTTFTGSVEGGIPFTGKPSALKGYIKPQPAAGDSGMVALGFSKWNGTSRDTIGSGLKWFPTTDTTWKPFTVPIAFAPGITPDSMNIIISCSAIGNQVFVAGSQMYIDSLMLDYGPISVELPTTDRDFSVWADGSRHLNYALSIEDNLSGNVSLYSIDGAEIYNAGTSNCRGSLDLSTLPAGIYIIKLTTGNHQVYTRKFLLR